MLICLLICFKIYNFNIYDIKYYNFFQQDGQLWLCAEQANQIWQCLAEQGVFVSDREACFKWFSKLMGEEQDLDPGITTNFFENNILRLDPTLLTESGIKCYERFFKTVNSKQGKLILKKRTLLMDDVDLIGTDYLWRVCVSGYFLSILNFLYLLRCFMFSLLYTYKYYNRW